MSADGDIVREAFLDVYLRTDTDQSWLEEQRGKHDAALARLEAAEAQRDRVEYTGIRVTALQKENQRLLGALKASEAQRDMLAEALRTICDIGETRDVEVARSALADAGLIADSDTTTEWKS